MNEIGTSISQQASCKGDHLFIIAIVDNRIYVDIGGSNYNGTDHFHRSGNVQRRRHYNAGHIEYRVWLDLRTAVYLCAIVDDRNYVDIGGSEYNSANDINGSRNVQRSGNYNTLD